MIKGSFTQNINLVAKSLEQKIVAYKFDLYHKNDAKRALQNIELDNGKTNKKLLKLSDEYAQDVFGWKGYAPWLYVYSATSETFKEGWIPDNYYGKVVVPKTKGNYGKLAFLKSLTTKLFESKLFPDIAYYVNGFFYSNNNNVLQEHLLKDFLFKNSNVVVFKVDNSLQGRGVFFIEKNTFDLNKIKVLGNGVFQHKIVQHPFFSAIMPDSIATIRITTVHDINDQFSARASILRIGRKNETHVNSFSSIRIPIDINSGELNQLGFINHWRAINQHPDTHFLFAGIKIPFFNKCISTALELHKAMPYVSCIGWDMTVDENENIKVMEWNGYNNGMTYSEATLGPCFKGLGWENLWKEL